MATTSLTCNGSYFLLADMHAPQITITDLNFSEVASIPIKDTLLGIETNGTHISIYDFNGLMKHAVHLARIGSSVACDL